MLVMTHTHGTHHRLTYDPQTAGTLLDRYGAEGNGWAMLRSHIKAVAISGGEGTAFVDGLRYHVRRATRAEALGQEDRLHEDEGEGRHSSDAYDEENLREQLAEALDALRAIVDGGSWHDDGSFVYWPADEDDDEDEGAIGVAATILAKHGRG